MADAFDHGRDVALTLTVEAGSEEEARRTGQKTVDSMTTEFDRLLAESIAAMRGLDCEALIDEARAVVRDKWQRPWPWLAIELVVS